MDLAGSLRRFGALRDRPGARLLFAGGQIADEAEQGIGFFDEPVKPALFQPQLFEEHLRLVGRQLRQLFLRLCADDEHFAPFLGGKVFHLFDEGQLGVRLAHILFGDVRGINDRLCGQQEQIAHLLLFLVRQNHGARALLVGEVVVHPLQKFRLGEELFVAPLGGVLRAVEALLHRLHVGEDEL